MKPKIKKTTFSLPIDLVLYLKTKNNQTEFVANAIKKAKEEEEKKKIKKAAKEMSECTKIWNELEDWNVTLND